MMCFESEVHLTCRDRMEQLTYVDPPGARATREVQPGRLLINAPRDVGRQRLLLPLGSLDLLTHVGNQTASLQQLLHEAGHRLCLVTFVTG